MNKKNDMKVLRVINSLATGGAERSILNMVPIHIKNGIEMDILLLNGKETYFHKELKKEGVNIYSLGINNNIYNPFLIFKILKYLKSYDIIHVHLFPASYWAALAKIFVNSNAKFVFTEHATHNRRRNIKIFKYIDRFIYKRYDKIISISNATDKNLKDYLNINLNTTVIYNGIDLKSITKEAEIETEIINIDINNYKVLLQVSSFRDAKDQDTLIRSLQHLPKNYCVMLVGEGERKKTCEKLANDIDVANRVFFFGNQKNVGQFIKIADILVMSSHWEGFGRAAVEGMALKKPVVASSVPGLSDVVGDAGLLFNKGDEKELAAIVLQLINDKKYYDTIASRCLKRSKSFNISNMIKGYEEVYHNLLNSTSH